ncbi:ABC transporter substrate-binding protein [Arcobacter roscoffensis]|uniref:ABC transporter substrate-binding protein n=1 Tax=Arcobacter roscoffensis TaxID=2961520 RepID=A0ABY5EAC1_9BACT|nr:ABC transporter substrate-binding protein [Arcobacter roscoffensis]UTJ07670.1 ABC transporter substrate-binding protein [Arcobacter roscoffensis]
MKNILKVLLLLTFLITGANALQKDEIINVMTAKVDNALEVLKQKDLETKDKANKIFALIDEIFDYELMGKISLGKKTWLSINDTQREEFIKAFETKLKNSYVDKLELYTDQKVKIIELSPYKKTRLQLKTEVVGKDEVYKINYNFYNNKKKSQWLIYDVDLLGVSIVQTYRKQFAGLLKEKSFDELLVILKDTKK